MEAGGGKLAEFGGEVFVSRARSGVSPTAGQAQPNVGEQFYFRGCNKPASQARKPSPQAKPSTKPSTKAGDRDGHRHGTRKKSRVIGHSFLNPLRD